MAGKNLSDFKVGDLVKRYNLNSDDNLGVIVADKVQDRFVYKVLWQEDNTYSYFAYYSAQQALVVVAESHKGGR
tara:strand:+ start:159 stop:380 length:222 start_codon:yes stop_codon:yes gene_type:complete